MNGGKRYRKSDVEFHGGRPAVNVKVPYLSGSEWDALAREVAEDEEIFPDPFVVAFKTRSYDSYEWLWEAACQDGWEQLQDIASEIWPYRVEVHSEGRCGGWAVINGLYDLESWDAIELARWAKFARCARAYADDVPYQMVSLFLLNVYDPPDPLIEDVWRASQAFVKDTPA